MPVQIIKCNSFHDHCIDVIWRNIQDFIISSGPKGNGQNSATEHVNGLTTKSAFFVLSDTAPMQDIVVQVRESYKDNVIYKQYVCIHTCIHTYVHVSLYIVLVIYIALHECWSYVVYVLQAL